MLGRVSGTCGWHGRVSFLSEAFQFGTQSGCVRPDEWVPGRAFVEELYQWQIAGCSSVGREAGRDAVNYELRDLPRVFHVMIGQLKS